MRTGELVKTQELEYAEDGKALKGFLAWDDGRTARRPGVLVFHENTGLTDHEKGRASRLADLGYVALACDLFGERTIPADDSKRREAFEEFRKNKLIPRARAGLDALCKHPCVDLTRVAAIGFCLGGMTALELARSGADLKAVVSFHGGLATATAAPVGRMKAKVLVCHGASDPYVKMDQVIAFANEMDAASADWQVILYGGAMHGFTNPKARGLGYPGVDYHEASDIRSWEAARQFLAEAFS